MLELFVDPDTLPFAVAATLMVAIGLLEIGLMLVGAGLSGPLDNLLPDWDVDLDVNLDGVSAQSPGVLASAFGWLHLGKVPLLVWLVLFLFWFSGVGFALQAVMANTVLPHGNALPTLLAVPIAAAAALLLVRFTGGWVGRLMPQVETAAVSRDALAGRLGTMLTGTARQGAPAQAKVRDAHGQTHYILVEPTDASTTLQPKSTILVVERRGPRFLAAATDPALFDNATMTQREESP